MIKRLQITLFFISILFSAAVAQTSHTLSVEYRTKKLPYGLEEKIPVTRPIIALALSGGGARGLAQIGVLRALKEAGIPIDVIVGTSMGSIVGGLYSAGYNLDQLDSIAKNTDWNALLASDRETNRRDLFVDQKITEDKAIFTLRLKGLKPILPTSFNNGQKLSTYLNLLALQAPIHVEKTFDELKVKFRAVCTDLITGNTVVINKGSLSQAMRASSSVSFFLSPVKIDSLVLVDGGLVANIPVKIASSIGSNYIIAVNTTSSLHPEDELTVPWVVADQIISIPMRLLNEAQLNNANIIIHPNLAEREAADFSNIDSLIQIGYESTLPFINKIKSSIDSSINNNLKEKEFYVHNVMIDDNVSRLEKPFIKKYSQKDSVSSYTILRDIYSLYKKGTYKSIKVEIKDFGNYSNLKFVTEQNPKIKYIKTKGISLLSKNTVDSLLLPLINTPYNGDNILSTLIKIIDIYRNLGYSLAEVEDVKFNEETGELFLSFDEGIISEIVIEGNYYTSRSIITREFPLHAGDYFLYKNVEKGLIDLRSTNLFDDVVLTVKNRGNKNILYLKVLERVSSLLRFGFSVDNENKAQISFDLRDENLFGSGTEMGLLLFGGARNRAYILEHKSNRVFNTYLTYKLNAYYQFNDVYSYNDNISTDDMHFIRNTSGEYRQIYYGASLAIGTQVERFGNVIIKGKYEYNQLKNKADAPITPDKFKVVSLKASSTIDTQDKYPYPEKGIYFTASYETAQKTLGSDVGFIKLGFNYKNYFTLDKRHTFSPRLMMGIGDKTLPLTQQYSLGGQNSFFGMRDDEFRGRQIFLASFEYRYKLPVNIFFDTYFKLRYDLGSTWNLQEQLRFKDLRHGIGATLSFNTPIGPAEFSVGRSFLFVKNLPGNPVSLGEVMFYFSIGYYY